MKYKFTLFFLLLFWSVTSFAQQTLDLDSAFTHAEKQTKVMLQEIEAATSSTQPNLVSPKTLQPTGKLKLTPSKDWTSGFFAGNLWFLYEHTQDSFWLNQAQTFTAKIEAEQYDTGTHDVGFKVYNSFGAGYRLTQNAAYRQVIIQTAKSLSTRFNPKTGVIRSWDHSTNRWKNPVIIDNMMNLELLFAATRLTGDSLYYKIAVSHANTTLKNHFRPDYSSWHVVDYDSLTGEVIKKTTSQGYSNSSAWARGQGWGLYGYTMCYRETKNPAYLEHAEKIAAFILNHPRLPADGVPYWDFDAPLIPLEPRDASAAAVMASALYELSTYSSQKDTFRAAADKILKNLATQYESPVGENRGFLLLHSTGNKPYNIEVDVPLIYADYYYLEALIRRQQINQPPQITSVPNQSVTVGNALRFVVAASDSNTNQVQTYSLVNAPTGATIDSKTGSFSWTPTQTGNFKFLIRVTDNGSPILYTEQPITVTVNPVKRYALQVSITGSGTVIRDPQQTTYVEGTEVKLKAVPATGYQFNGWSGDFTGTNAALTLTMNSDKRITAQFALIPPQVVKVNVIDAADAHTILTLQDDVTLDLATLPTTNLSLEALINTATTKSVVFELSGELNRRQVESAGPYVLFGDTKGDPNAWTPAIGSYSLKVTPYSASAGGGTAGKPVILNFKVINSANINRQNRATPKNTDLQDFKTLVAFPNPTYNGQVTIHLPVAFKGEVRYTLLSLIGAKLAEGTFPAETSAFTLDFSRHMSVAGVYYMQVENATTKEIIKIVRQ
ncbi:InlB B-repeat-containing protein [Adhaeribacter pallidiroseus]|uniref:Unsaturated chondroitin disaccharide hydrolase n=1 Tax=Adhaeribacter pallidiroseus TaxID=2072847 RepID=A0A369QGB9_9BACT|nr:putative Ig domain-containing protein [Adhaeribacter pallidiroseus]RDC63462.1 Unsaturated chondroitin disaccharide hydrolase [Adhaeribacter pallidiroseus]